MQGQLWQECERAGCETEPVCADCLYCEKHCLCPPPPTAEERRASDEAAKVRADLRAAFRPEDGEYRRGEGDEPLVLVGERIDHPDGGQNIHGGGQWFVVEPSREAVWHVVNNGADGDNWALNNVQTGGAGAIGRKFPMTEERRALLDALASRARPETPARQDGPDADWSAMLAPGVWFVPGAMGYAVTDTLEAAKRCWRLYAEGRRGANPADIRHFPSATISHASQASMSVPSFCLLSTGDLLIGHYVSLWDWAKAPPRPILLTEAAEKLIAMAMDGNRKAWGKQEDGTRPWHALKDATALTKTKVGGANKGRGEGSDLYRFDVAWSDGRQSALWGVEEWWACWGEDADAGATWFLYESEDEAKNRLLT